MSIGSNFETDIKKEQVLAEYLDGLYREKGMCYERINDSKRQHRGIDLIINIKDKKALVDEKAQLDHINRSLPTFAFEIGYYKNDKHIQGWLFDGKKETTHYMLVTDIMSNNSDGLTSADDIASVKLLWLNRSKLIAALAQKGIDQAFCEQKEREARGNETEDRTPTDHKGHYFVLSQQKGEAPFNLIISRAELLKIGTQVHPKE